jgi:hypothetical protein
MDLEECPECHELFPEDELQAHFVSEHPRSVPEKEED